jgi:enoyl-CoA hydratase/carnithine racemase
MIDLSRDGDVFVLRVDAGENRFGPDTLRDWNAALDEVEAADAPKALVTTGTGKFYSNGLDLDYMLSSGDPQGYLQRVLAVMARILAFPAYTVAAINGHAFGAGGQIALAHDARVMRADRGYFCMPEIDMKAPLHPGMTAIIRARLPHQSAHEVIVTGTRYGGELAASRSIVDEVAAEDQVVPRAVALAAPYAAKADPAMATLKRGLYAPQRLGSRFVVEVAKREREGLAQGGSPIGAGREGRRELRSGLGAEAVGRQAEPDRQVEHVAQCGIGAPETDVLEPLHLDAAGFAGQIHPQPQARLHSRREGVAVLREGEAAKGKQLVEDSRERSAALAPVDLDRVDVAPDGACDRAGLLREGQRRRGRTRRPLPGADGLVEPHGPGVVTRRVHRRSPPGRPAFTRAESRRPA